MNKPHVHADLIKAWADGAAIEMEIEGKWVELDPQWAENRTYRIKPKPVTVRYRVALMGTCATYLSLAENDKEIHAMERAAGFRRWLTDWQEVEV